MTAPYRGSSHIDLSRERESAALRAVVIAIAVASGLAVVDLAASVAEYAFVRTRHAGPPIGTRFAALAAAHALYVISGMLVLRRTIARTPTTPPWIALVVVIGASLGATWLTTEAARSMVTNIPEANLSEWLKDLEQYFSIAPLFRPAALGVLLVYAAMLWQRRPAPTAPIVCPHCAAPIADQSAEKRSSMS